MPAPSPELPPPQADSAQRQMTARLVLDVAGIAWTRMNHLCIETGHEDQEVKSRECIPDIDSPYGPIWTALNEFNSIEGNMVEMVKIDCNTSNASCMKIIARYSGKPPDGFAVRIYRPRLCPAFFQALQVLKNPGQLFLP
jgi:hypothetical protein